MSALILICSIIDAQTEISGIIETDSVLSFSYSPYLVTDNLVITPDGSITIEPGVEVRFAGGTKLEVRGEITALGTEEDSITFTSNSSTAQGSWEGIEINNTEGPDIEFSYCKFLFASNAVYETSCGNGTMHVSHSRFHNNGGAIGGYACNTVTIDSCLFTNNYGCIWGPGKIVTNSVFLNNDYGISSSVDFYVYNSTFLNNSVTAIEGGNGTVDSCIIENNGTGIDQRSYPGIEITNCIIAENDTGIMISSGYGLESPVENNLICDNDPYNIKNKSDRDIELYNNCWCTSDSASIENKILDGLDDNEYGLISYDIFNAACDSVIKKVDKTMYNVIIWAKANSPYIISEDYAVFPSMKLLIEPGVEVRFAGGTKLEVRGEITALGTEEDSITFTSNSSTAQGSWEGIEINNTEGPDIEFSYCKFLFASNAVYETSCGNGTMHVSHSRFHNNGGAIGGYACNTVTIDSCLFTNNYGCIWGPGKIVTNSVFLNNDYGISSSVDFYVYNSTFLNNSVTAIEGGNGTVDSCIIENNGTGIDQRSYPGIEITNCIIAENDTGIMISSGYGLESPVENNLICDNDPYNIKNKSDRDIELYNNCWCTSDFDTIEDKILDGWDNSSYGLVDYTIFYSDCITPILKTIKALNQFIYYTGLNRITYEGIYIYPNPASETLYIKNINADNIYIEILNLNGQVLLSSEKDITDISILKPGVYMVRLKINNDIFTDRLTIIK